jgi:hypothetical protein
MYVAYVYASSHICTRTCAYHICGVVTWYTPYMQHMYIYVYIICIRVVAHMHAHVYISRIAPSSRSTHIAHVCISRIRIVHTSHTCAYHVSRRRPIVHTMHAAYAYTHAVSYDTCTQHVCHICAPYTRHARKMHGTCMRTAVCMYVRMVLMHAPSSICATWQTLIGKLLAIMLTWHTRAQF